MGFPAKSLHIILIGITICFGVLGGIASWSDYFSPIDYPVFYFIGISVPVILAFNFVLFLFLLFRKTKWSIIPLIAVLLNISFVGKVYRFQSFPNKPAHHSLKVVSYNVGAIVGDTTIPTFSLMADSLANENADLVCLQEVSINAHFTKEQLRSCFNKWPFYSIPGNDDQSILQVALFSKYPILHAELITYPEVKNCSMWCDISIAGKPMRIINNHLQTTAISSNAHVISKMKKRNDESIDRLSLYKKVLTDLNVNVVRRVEQAKIIRQLMDTTHTPIILCGDLNSLPTSYIYRTIKGNDLNDGFREAGHGYMSTFKYFKHTLRIDYVFYSNQFVGVKCTSPRYSFSDHYPVIMTLGYDKW